MNSSRDSSYRVSGITYDRKTGRPVDVPANRKPVKARTSSSTTSRSSTSASGPSTRKPGKSTTYRKPSTTKGPNKDGSFYRSKGATTKGGPTKSGSSYAGKRKPRTWLQDNYKPGAKGIKSSRLSKALTNLKVRDYSKKKK